MLLLTLLVAFLVAGTLTAGPAVAGVDDYPTRWRTAPADTVVDDWGYWNRECTSFVAWRLHGRNGFEMPRAIGDAGNWGSWASAHGYLVNTSPAVGSVAWWSSGHVAWVEAISGNTVTIEEYNFNFTHTYNRRTIAANSVSGYIHFRDLPPPPPPSDPDGDGISGPADACPAIYGLFSWDPWQNGCQMGYRAAPSKVVGDFNGDGKADIAAIYKTGLTGAPGARIWMFNGSPTGPAAPVLQWDDPTWTSEAMKPTSGDFNGDRYDDLAVFYKIGTPGTRMWLFPGGPGGLSSAPTIRWEDANWTWESIRPITGDFNGDGKTDLGAVYNIGGSGAPGSRIWIFNGTPAGPSATPYTTWTGNWDFENLKPTTGDVNGDGKTDLVIFTRCGAPCTNMWIFPGTASGLPGTPTWQRQDPGWTWESIKALTSDYNADGYADVAVVYNIGGPGNPGSRIWLFNGSATGPSAPTQRWTDNWAWESIKPAAGDVNGDGKADLVMLTRCGAPCTNMWIFPGTTSGPANTATFQRQEPGWTWESILI